MKSYTAVIVDDEALSRRRLRALLMEVPWLSVIGEAASGREAMELITRRPPDVAFLDIQMPGTDGITLARSLPVPPLIVYTTAHAEHAVDAYDIGAVDYLLKPFGRQRTTAMLQRLATALEHRSPQAGLTRLLVRIGSRLVNVDVADIRRFEARDDYVALHTEHRVHLASIRMNELESQLPKDVFIRVHRSHILNMRFVREVRPDGTGRLRVRMMDGAIIRTSRDRTARLRELFH